MRLNKKKRKEFKWKQKFKSVQYVATENKREPKEGFMKEMKFDINLER